MDLTCTCVVDQHPPPPHCSRAVPQAKLQKPEVDDKELRAPTCSMNKHAEAPTNIPDPTAQSVKRPLHQKAYSSNPEVIRCPKRRCWMRTPGVLRCTEREIIFILACFNQCLCLWCHWANTALLALTDGSWYSYIYAHIIPGLLKCDQGVSVWWHLVEPTNALLSTLCLPNIDKYSWRQDT